MQVSRTRVDRICRGASVVRQEAVLVVRLTGRIIFHSTAELSSSSNITRRETQFQYLDSSLVVIRFAKVQPSSSQFLPCAI